MTSEGGAPPASGGSKSVEVTGSAESGHSGSGGGGESPANSAAVSTSSPQTSPPVPENIQTSGFNELGASGSREASSPSRVSADSAVVAETLLSVPAPVTTPSGTVTCTASPKKTSEASPEEFRGIGPRECAGARPKERPLPASSTPRSPYKTDTASAASPTSMVDQQGSFHSPSEVSLSPSGAGDGNESTPRRYSGSTEDEGERERHASVGHHWHLPFRKKITIVEAASPPKSVSFVDQVDGGPATGAPGGEHGEHQKEHHRSIGHAISHSSLGRAVSHSSIGHAVSQFFKKGHHSPPGSEGDSSSPAAEGGAEGGSPSPHHSIGHVVAEFFKKGLHHTPPEVEVGRSSTPPVEIGEDVVSSLPSGPDEADVRSGVSVSPAATPTKSPHDHHHHEHHSIASMGHAVAKAFKKLNTSIVGSPGKPPRWRTWRRGGDAADPKTRRYRRRSLPGRRLSESAATTSYEVAVLSLLRRRRSASRSPDRRARSPPPDRDAALQRLRRHALRRHRAADFLNFRRWRRSCPDLSTATPVELERVQPPIRHVVMRRAIVDELERIVLCYPGDKLVQHIQLFEWAGVNKDDESQIYIKFFKFHKCYDLIPTSAKLVVFDTQLLVKKAFFALVYNGVRAAPLWDSSKQQYVGMLTITDFIRILQMYYRNSDERIEELEEHKLDTWRTVLESDSKPLIYIEPEASLFDAITTLLQNKIHRLPVIDPVSGDVLYIITHKRILRFLCLYLHNLPRPSLLNRTLGELRIGTYEKIETARPGTPVIEALTKFVERRVSALPIVDADNKLTHIYAKFDVINLAAEKTYNNLDVPLMTANSHRSENKVEACRLSDTLLQVLEKIVHAEVHRLVITDDEQHVIGIISLSDILDALVIRPHEYNTMAESNSGSEPAGEDEPHMIVEEEPGDEEDPVAAAAGIGRLNLSDPGHKDG